MRPRNQRIHRAWANLPLCLVWLAVRVSAQRPSDPSPTPGASVTFSAPAGLHEAAFTLQLGVAGAEGATLRYSTDGSIPSPTTGTAYAGPWQVTNTLILRVAAFRQGVRVSPIATRSFLFLPQIRD